MIEPLDSAMDNVLAKRLGTAAAHAGNPARTDVGDLIDRGLILRRLLHEQGFGLVVLKNGPSSYYAPDRNQI